MGTTLEFGTGTLGLAGAWPRREILAYNRAGAAMQVGRVYMIDLMDTDDNIDSGTADVFHKTGAASTDHTCNVIAAGTQTVKSVWVVALDTAADDTVGRYLVQGLEDIFVTGALDPMNATTADPTDLWLTAEGSAHAALDTCTNDADHVLGILLEPNTSGADARRKVLFDGFGIGANSTE